MTLTIPTRKPPTTGAPVFSVDGLWKVFGPKADRIPADPELSTLAPADLRSAPSTSAGARASSSWAGPAPASPPSCAA